MNSDKNKEDKTKADFKQADGKERLVEGKNEKTEITLTPNENKRSRFLILLPKNLKDLADFDIDNARVEIEKKLADDETIELLSQFEIKTFSDILREFLIVCVIAIVCVLLAPYYGATFGPDTASISQQALTLAGIFLAIFFIVTFLTGVNSKKTFFAMTNKRIIVIGPGEGAWFWSIYAEDISKIETVSKYGKPVIRLNLIPGHKTMAYVSKLDLNGVKDTTVLVDKLENYKHTIATPPEARLDKPANITKESVKKETGKFVYRSFEVTPAHQIILGIICLFGCGFLYAKELQHQNWVPTGASIVRVEVAPHGEFKKYYTLDKHFKYKVDGESHEYIDKTRKRYDTEDSASTEAAKKKPAEIKVYYDPENPADSEENPIKNANTNLMFALFGLGAIVSGLISNYTIKGKGTKQIVAGYAILAACLLGAYLIFQLFQIK